MEFTIKDILFVSGLIIVFIWLVIFQYNYIKSIKIRKDLILQFNNQDLLKLLTKYIDETNNLKELTKELKIAINNTRNLADLSIHKVGFLRYNPFQDTGGDQSFTIALLDAKNNGIVISSIHSREGTRVYAKAIEAGNSKYHLTDEEKKSIKLAIESVREKE